jgi:class 3 adenylate cyclase
MEAPQLDRHLAAILSADVEGYSRLMHGDEEATMATLSAHRTLVDELIDRHRGRIANTAGDSVLAEFASVLDAVHCAIEIQKTLANDNEIHPEARSMSFRIGINVGDVMAKDGDIFGDGVNVAARLEGLVKGGEICVSRGVRDYLRHHSGMVFEDLGEQLVKKNIAHPVRAFRLREGDDPGGAVVARAQEIAVPSDEPVAPATASELSAESETALELACGKASGTVAPANSKPTLNSTRRVRLRRLPEPGWMQRRAHHATLRRQIRLPMRSISPSGIRLRTATVARNWRRICDSIRTGISLISRARVSPLLT